MRETDIERRACKKLRDRGWKTIKLITTSEPGMPDRLLLKDGRVVFVEWKRDAYINAAGKKIKRTEVDPIGLQALRHKQLREQGFEVVVAWKETDIEHLFFAPYC